jgi:hypothetical protein
MSPTALGFLCLTKLILSVSFQEGNIIATAQIVEIGNFLFTQLAPGLYELILLGHETEMHIQSLAI